MANKAQAKGIVVKNMYGEGDQSLPMVGRECGSPSHWSQSLENITQKSIKAFYKFNTNIYTRTTRMQKQYMKWKINIMAFVHGGCHLELPQKKTLLGSLSGWAFDTISVLSNGVVI